MDVIYAIWLRNMQRFVKSRSRVIGSIMMPLFFICFLGYGLYSVVSIPTMQSNYLEFLIPGMVTMSVMFSSIGAGTQIIWDKQFGILKETMVAPISRYEIMLGQTIGGATTAVLQGFLILFFAFIIGLIGSDITGFISALVIMLIIGISFTAFGIALASSFDNMPGFQLSMSFIAFPIFGLSGAFYPISALPEFIRPLTLIDPLTYGVEGVRYGLTGSSQIHPLICMVVVFAFACCTVAFGAYQFQRIKS